MRTRATLLISYGTVYVWFVVDAELSDVDIDDLDSRPQYDGKIGTKKLRKLEEKAARKAQREVCSSPCICWQATKRMMMLSGYTCNAVLATGEFL